MKRLLLFMLGPSLLLSACISSTPSIAPDLETGEGSLPNDSAATEIMEPFATVTMEPFLIITSEPGYVTLHGNLAVLDPTTISPAPDDAIFLVPMDEENPGLSTIPQFQQGEVPQAQVDERTGEFVFINVQPGRYAVVVLTKGGAQIPTRKFPEGTMSIITLEETQEDQIIELGTLSVP